MLLDLHNNKANSTNNSSLSPYSILTSSSCSAGSLNSVKTQENVLNEMNHELRMKTIRPSAAATPNQLNQNSPYPKSLANKTGQCKPNLNFLLYVSFLSKSYQIKNNLLVKLILISLNTWFIKIFYF